MKDKTEFVAVCPNLPEKEQAKKYIYKWAAINRVNRLGIVGTGYVAMHEWKGDNYNRKCVWEKA